MLAERLDKAWRARQMSVPIDAVMKFTADGLVLGAGTVMAPAGESGRAVWFEGDEARLLTLLSAAHLRPVQPDALNHIRIAVERWGQHEESRALVHLALSRAHKLEQPVRAAHRLFLAEGLLQAGVEPGAIFKALQIDPAILEPFAKAYDPNQPRVAAGSGRLSGQWTSGSIGAAAEDSVNPTPLPKDLAI